MPDRQTLLCNIITCPRLSQNSLPVVDAEDTCFRPPEPVFHDDVWVDFDCCRRQEVGRNFSFANTQSV